MGLFVGQQTKKIVGFGVAQKRCVQCEYNFRSKVGGVDHSRHPCKKNHMESSGAMETRILCKLQVAVTQGGARLKVCISDGDVKLGDALKSIDDDELADVQRVLDLNHLVRNFGKALTALKASHWRKSPSLTDRNIQLLCTMFTRIVHHHRVSTSSVTIPLNMHPDDEDPLNDVDAHTSGDQYQHDDIVKSLRDLAPLMEASLREDKVGAAVEGDVEIAPLDTEPSAYDGNVRRCLLEDFENVDVNVDLSNDIAELVTKGTSLSRILQVGVTPHMLLLTFLATQDRQRHFNISDHFNDDDENEDNELLEDDPSAGLSFQVSRERVIKLRDNLVNMLPHYFNRHTGTIIIPLQLNFTLIVNGILFRMWVVVSVQEPGRLLWYPEWLHLDGG